jgi:hypothetical protein
MIEQDKLEAYTAALVTRIEEIADIHAKIGILKVSLSSFPSLGGLDIEQTYNTDAQQKIDVLHDEASKLLMTTLIYLSDLRVQNIGLTSRLLAKHIRNKNE